MTTGKKKSHDRRKDRDAAALTGATYPALLATLRSTLGPMGSQLRERSDRRSRNLLHMLTGLRPFFEGLSQLHEALLWLAGQPGVDNEIAHLLRDAARDVLSGVETLLAEADPRALDEARLLMEIEFLFLDFARNPGRLDVWRHLRDRDRDREFGFAALRRREEQAQGVAAGHVLFDQEEYRLHSADVHPQPVQRELPLSAPDDVTGLFHDAGDLLHHASRVWRAGLAAAGMSRPGQRPFKEGLPQLDAVDAATRMLDENNRAHGLLGQ